MNRYRLTLGSGVLLLVLFLCNAPSMEAKGRKHHPEAGPPALLPQILGRPADRSVTLTVFPAVGVEAYFEWWILPDERARQRQKGSPSHAHQGLGRASAGCG